MGVSLGFVERRYDGIFMVEARCVKNWFELALFRSA
jgi:hypothetical protein